MKKTLAIAISSVISSALMSSSVSYAAPNSFVDARSFAMGGVGVASSRPSHASFFNPALLAVTHNDESDDFGIVLPSVNVRGADDEEVVKQIEDFQDNDYLDNLNNAISTYQNSPTSANKDATLSALNDLEAALIELDDDAVRVDLGVGLSVQIPSKRFSLGIFADGALRATVKGSYEDQATVDAYRTALINDNPTALDPNTELDSSARVIAAGYAEAGISIARQFEIGKDNNLSVGLSPKFMQVSTFDYSASVNSFEEDDFDAAEYETNKSTFNFDLGVASQFGEDHQWTVGFSVQNVIPVEVETVSGVNVEMNPIAKVGVSHHSEWHTIAVDLDLTENEAFGFEGDNQYVAIGAEFDVFDTLQLRVGARHNIADASGDAEIEETSQVTAGVGFSPFGLHIDVSAMASDTDLGAAAELGFAF